MLKNKSTSPSVIALLVILLSLPYYGATTLGAVPDFGQTFGFFYGLMTRALGSKSGFYLVEKGSQFFAEAGRNDTENVLTPCEEKQFSEHMQETAKLLIGFDIGVTLWIAAYFLYMMEMKPQLYGSPAGVPNIIDLAKLRATVLTQAHQSGMDTWVGYRAISALVLAILKVLNSTDEWSKHVFDGTLLSFVGAFVFSWLSFMLGEEVANKVAFERLTATLLIFTIGVGLTEVMRRALFDYIGSFNRCEACKEFYTAGDELAYVASGVIPGYWQLLKWIQLWKDRTRPHID